MTEPPSHAPGSTPRHLPRGLPAPAGLRRRLVANARRLVAKARRPGDAVPRPPSIAKAWRAGRSGIWRVSVADDSMRPSIRPGDWLLLDPTVRRWPRRGTVVVAREPETDLLIIKRVAARPGDHVHLRQGLLHLAEDEAWLLGDGAGSVDSRRYGPVGADRLVGRAWFRYWPPRRIALLRRRA